LFAVAFHHALTELFRIKVPTALAILLSRESARSERENHGHAAEHERLS
jgi:hypothetical protein